MRPPNIVVFYADDMGYADPSCFGGTAGATPHIDALAGDGVRLTSFYVAQAVCSASRTALLTGCYPNRLGIHGALGPNARHGIGPGETTIGDIARRRGYATCCIGKWHLGHLPPFLPTRHGFDEYLGLPYSNDMWPRHPEAPKAYPPLQLYENERVVDPDIDPDDQARLTGLYTDRAVRFVERHRRQPFLLYLAWAMPHVPIFAGKRFLGSTRRGLYADVLREIDASVGAVRDALRRHGLERDTLIVFASDNGPWLSYGDHAGSSGPLREGKGTSWEGGVRVPGIACWPGQIPAGTVCTEPAMTIDLLPTFAGRIGTPLPRLPIDGKDIWPLLSDPERASSPQEAYWFYYNVNELQAVRRGRWKLILPHAYRTMNGQASGHGGTPGKYRMEKTPLALYDLEADIGETTDLSARRPVVVREMLRQAERARADLGDSLTGRTGSGRREPGRV